jgi:quercetin dioxygenase-like cupin family protein
MNRFCALPTWFAALVFFLFLASARADSSASPANEPNEEVHRLYKEIWSGQTRSDIVMLTVNYPPGAGDSPHEHQGLTFVYVLEGEMLSQLNNGQAKVYKKGETWLERPHDRHIVNRNPSSTSPAKILVFFVVKHGDKLTTDLPSPAK